MGQKPQTIGAARRRFQQTGCGLERLIPRSLPPGPIGLFDLRREHAVVAVDALVAEPVTIGDPGLIDLLARARYHAHEAAAQHVAEELRADPVVRRHQRILRHLPAAAAVTERLAVERADRAQIDDVARELVIDAALDVGADLHVLATAGGPHLLNARDVLAEAHAARAVNAARHVGRDQGTQVLVLDHALALDEARYVAAEAERQILQLAFPALIADRAVERVIDEQELHRRALRAEGFGRVREDLHALGYRGRAGRQRLRCLLDLDQTHAAVGRDRQLLVIAEAGGGDSLAIGHAHEELVPASLHGDAVDFDIDLIVAHAAARSTLTMLRPPCSTMYSNSCRKCLRKLCTGHAAASPRPQIVWPSMRFATSSSRFRSSCRPCPARMRLSVRLSQPVPSRHGVHWPQDSVI